MTNDIILLIYACCATAHIVMSCVLAVYARHKVQYLALTWIMGIFGVAMALTAPFHYVINQEPGILHPVALLALTALSYLQSIYPMSIPMPAYLQWGRMLKYARPTLFIYAFYLIALLCGLSPRRFDTWGEILENWFSIDLWLRLAAFGLSIFYVVNILRLPKHLAHRTELPLYLKGYCSALGFSVIFFICVTLWYQPIAMMIYIVGFTLLNLYLCFRTLENMALSLPKPAIEKVEEEPTQEVIAKAEKEDFNEANRQRFQRVEFWMQNHREEWTQSTFNRDQLCEQVGINRHLLLQCVRSQGYNSTHEYLNTYRFVELKRLIQRGQVRTASETSDAGFGTAKTARSVFLQMSGESLDDFLAAHKNTISSEK